MTPAGNQLSKLPYPINVKTLNLNGFNNEQLPPICHLFGGTRTGIQTGQPGPCVCDHYHLVVTATKWFRHRHDGVCVTYQSLNAYERIVKKKLYKYGKDI
ncbi:hypothetical protein TNCV_4259441 [Trichonephila clavipes]|nr:hypothetical protein TNCV_4259441 [Trichonephila clavipes]